MTSIRTVGYWSGVAACTATLAYVLAQMLQLAQVLRPPLDGMLIYGTSLCIVVPFIFEMLALHHLTPPRRQFWSHAALIFTVIYAVFVTANYVVQLATVIPAKLSGAADAIAVLDQTPHSMFWNYDAVGYLMMGLAAACAVPAIAGEGFERWVRRALVAHALVTPLIAVVYFGPPLFDEAAVARRPVGDHGAAFHADAGDHAARCASGKRGCRVSPACAAWWMT